MQTPIHVTRCATFLRFALLLGLLTASALPTLAWAEENQATIVAFEALLSLSQTQPPEDENGYRGWGHEAPPGFVFEEGSEEAALIAWLKKQKKNGADLNAMRHGGTMLHHVIRAGMVNTVSWLLANGADPLIEGEHDALELALTHQQEKIFNLLVKRPGVLDAQRDGLYRAWLAVVANRSGWGWQKLVDARVPLPAGKSAQLLLDDALRAGNVRLVRALTEADPDRALRAKAQSADEDIEIADQRLAQPIFLSLIGQARSDDEVDRLFRLRIRRPFDDPAFANQAVRNALWTPNSASLRTFERMPDAALLEAFKDKGALYRWWQWLSHLPEKDDRAAAMARWGDLPLRKPEELLMAAAKGIWFDRNEKDPNAAAAWGEMLAKLRSPLPEGVQGKLWMFVPQAHRLTLLKLGYRPSSQELRWWIDNNDMELILAFWPEILAIRPEIGRTSHELLFDPGADGSGYYCISWRAEKALPLTAAATSPEKPYTMEAACWYQASDTMRHTLLNLGWVIPPSPEMAGRVVLDKQQCAFQSSAAWRRALAGVRWLTTRDGESIPVDVLLAAAVPGERDCVLLVWGGFPGGRLFIDEDSFEGTYRLTPCADGNYATEIWRLRNGQIDSVLQKNLPFPGGMTLIRDTSDGKQYWLGGNEPLGTCGQKPPQLFQFETVDGQAATLRALPKTHPTMQALLSQCHGEEHELLECLGYSYSPPAADIADARVYPEQGYGMGWFADAHWNAERQAFVDAVLEFKPDVLSAMKADGVFPHWITDALSAVSASSLPVAEKRRRTAWLFRDRSLLRSALEPQMLDGLLDWLPREDWGPIIQEGPSFLSTLRYAAEQKGKTSLACLFATALKQPCQRKEE
ncbi:MAG: ankyrin repeat domain-containing protein [Azoarcus sp.]|jgi:hypothetical protein|nr:ankyrin repeat domain-containing protein [Azoarcus sp.]